MKLAAAVLSTVATVTLASSAFAIDLDLTNMAPGTGTPFNPHGATSWQTTVDGITVKITPVGGTIYYADPVDGFGIMGPSYEDDEIEGPVESLTVEFLDAGGNPVAVVLDSFNVADLFYEDVDGHYYNEIGEYQVDGSNVVEFTPASGVTGYSSPNGEGTVGVGATTTTLVLTAPGKIESTQWVQVKKKWGWGYDWQCITKKENHEFALAGLSFHVENVPELSASGLNGAILLLGGLGLVLGGRRRLLGAVA
jgi:hypothetical protein